MKRFSAFALMMVLTGALFTGCGCTGTRMEPATTPTMLPTTIPTIATTEPTTVPHTHATRPSTAATVPTQELPESETGTVATDGDAQSRSRGLSPSTGR